MQPILYPNKGCQDGYWDDTYHHGVTTGGDSTCFGDNGISGDTVPSSSGIRVKAQQPIYVNPRVKFPTVYEIDTSSGGGEEGMRPLHGGRGFPLVRYPSGQVKVLWGASLSELYRDLDWDSCLVRSNGDRDNGNIKEWEVVEATEEECTEEDAMETLNDSCPRKYGRPGSIGRSSISPDAPYAIY
ncbi:hypothetical protein EC991_008587 [Linnemannia zychae]|nr:hypothetical protein EC991_008587 [Linnemannia zychae]